MSPPIDKDFQLNWVGLLINSSYINSTQWFQRSTLRVDPPPRHDVFVGPAKRGPHVAQTYTIQLSIHYIQTRHMGLPYNANQLGWCQAGSIDRHIWQSHQSCLGYIDFFPPYSLAKKHPEFSTHITRFDFLFVTSKWLLFSRAEPRRARW